MDIYYIYINGVVTVFQEDGLLTLSDGRALVIVDSPWPGSACSSSHSYWIQILVVTSIYEPLTMTFCGNIASCIWKALYLPSAAWSKTDHVFVRVRMYQHSTALMWLTSCNVIGGDLHTCLYSHQTSESLTQCLES